jgi:hypothetical protein
MAIVNTLPEHLLEVMVTSINQTERLYTLEKMAAVASNS